MHISHQHFVCWILVTAFQSLHFARCTSVSCISVASQITASSMGLVLWVFLCGRLASRAEDCSSGDDWWKGNILSWQVVMLSQKWTIITIPSWRQTWNAICVSCEIVYLFQLLSVQLQRALLRTCADMRREIVLVLFLGTSVAVQTPQHVNKSDIDNLFKGNVLLWIQHHYQLVLYHSKTTKDIKFPTELGYYKGQAPFTHKYNAVQIAFYLQSMFNLNGETMDFQIKCWLFTSWLDPRLQVLLFWCFLSTTNFHSLTDDSTCLLLLQIELVLFVLRIFHSWRIIDSNPQHIIMLYSYLLFSFPEQRLPTKHKLHLQQQLSESICGHPQYSLCKEAKCCNFTFAKYTSTKYFENTSVFVQ